MPETKRPLKVFLCHASVDKAKVRELYRYLHRRGIRPWFDEIDLVGGQDWQIEIPKALLTSDAIIICLTQNSVDKEGYIQKEIKFALDKALEMPEGRVYLIPVRLEECEVPYSLSRYHWVDLFEQNGFSRLMKSLKTRATQLERTAIQLPEPEESKPDLASSAKQLPNVESAVADEDRTLKPVLLESAATNVPGSPRKLQRRTINAMMVAAVAIIALIVATLRFPLSASPFRPEPLFKVDVSPYPVRAVAFSPDGSRLAVAGEDNLIYLLDTKDGREILQIKGHTDVVTSITWSPDGSRLASGSDDRSVRIWDAATGRQLSSFAGDTKFVSAVAWSHDGKWIASAGAETRITVWNVASGEIVLELDKGVYGNSVAWSPDDTMLAVTGNQRVLILDPSNRSEVKNLVGDWGDINGVDWSPDGRYLAAASHDSDVLVWQVDNWSEQILEGHTSNVTDIAWSKNSQLLASVSYDTTVRIWDVGKNNEIRQLANPAGALTLDWSQDGKRLAGGGEVAKVGYIEIWDATQFDE